MSIDPTRTPVLIGIGQSIERDATTNSVELAVRASEAALSEALSNSKDKKLQYAFVESKKGTAVQDIRRKS